ncbi:MAG: hypothetical protein M1837_005084 [Sclerophora amabilis]|nr:MAG: hypothetical protein M1837_005084 [Sclerophora amabilis]
MAQAKVVYTNAHGSSNLRGSLFEGQKFWIAQRVPQRSRLLEQIQSNGGEITALDKKADVRIVDHVRKDIQPGCHSFRYITESVRNGQLEDLDAHAVGPPSSTARSVGASRPGKRSRTPFTAEDDRILYKWVTDQEHKGERVLGNEIYKQLEERNPRHTYQSWRDRWVKYVSLTHQSAPQNSLPTPPLNATSPQAEDDTSKRKSQRLSAGFTVDEFQVLLGAANDILNIDEKKLAEAWDKWSEANPEHTAAEWRQYFEQKVAPIYNGISQQPSPHDVIQSLPMSKDALTKPNGNAKELSVTAMETKDSVEGSERFGKGSSVRPAGSKLSREHKKYAQAQNSPRRQHQPFPASANPESRSPLNIGAQTPQNHTSARRKHLDNDAKRTSSSNSKSRAVTLTKRDRGIDETASSEQELEQGIAPTSKRRKLQKSTTGDQEIPSYPKRNICRSRPGSNTATSPKANGGTSQHEESDKSPGSPISSPSVTDPTLIGKDTQAIFLAETQAVDFGVPPPIGGWDDDDEEEEEEKNEDLEIGGKVEKGTDVPRIIPGKSHTPPSLPHSPDATSVPLLDSWIDAHITPTVSEDSVILALKCTSNDPMLAERVLSVLSEGKDVPHDVPGIWTAEEDKALESGDSKELERLETKHGQEGFERRWTFLKWYNGEGEESAT